MIIMDLQRKVEILLQENEKLHGILEEKIRDLEGSVGVQDRLRIVNNEMNKLQLILNQKNEAEIYWRKKFEEIEGKIKTLFFQTNGSNF